MAIKFTNNASAELASSISSSATTITVASGKGALFPTLGAGDYFYATLVDSSNNLEIVKVTARSSDTMTVVRAQDSTTAKAFVGGDKFELRPTAGGLTAIVTSIDDHIADTTAAHAASAISNTPAGNIAATDVQAAINELDTEKLAKSGGSMTGPLSVSVTGANNAITGAAGGASNYGGAFTNNDNGILIGFQTAGSAAANRIFTGSNAGVEKIYCDKDGNLVASANVTAYSDARLKTEVRTISNALELTNSMRGVYFVKDGEAGVGVIAQEMQKVLPQVVYSKDEYLSVAYGNIVGVLIEAVKELTARVQELEGK